MLGIISENVNDNLKGITDALERLDVLRLVTDMNPVPGGVAIDFKLDAIIPLDDLCCEMGRLGYSISTALTLYLHKPGVE